MTTLPPQRGDQLVEFFAQRLDVGERGRIVGEAVSYTHLDVYKRQGSLCEKA